VAVAAVAILAALAILVLLAAALRGRLGRRGVLATLGGGRSAAGGRGLAGRRRRHRQRGLDRRGRGGGFGGVGSGVGRLGYTLAGALLGGCVVAPGRFRLGVLGQDWNSSLADASARKRAETGWVGCAGVAGPCGGFAPGGTAVAWSDRTRWHEHQVPGGGKRGRRLVGPEFRPRGRTGVARPAGGFRPPGSCRSSGSAGPCRPRRPGSPGPGRP